MLLNSNLFLKKFLDDELFWTFSAKTIQIKSSQIGQSRAIKVFFKKNNDFSKS
jgi:hypothetical protein